MLKMIPKPSKNGSKLLQITFKIQAWRHQNRSPEGSGAGLDASWAVLGHPGFFWQASWVVLEASWAVFGRERWPTWVQVAPQDGAKIDKKSIPKLLIFVDASWNRFLHGCWWILDANISKVEVKMGSKNDANFEQRFFKKPYFSLGKP